MSHIMVPVRSLKRKKVQLCVITHRQSGFTLVELMISLVLGLIISAAALALFLDSGRNVRVQESADDVQEAAVFNLTYLEKEIAMANLGAYRPMTAASPWTGIILSGNILQRAAVPASSTALASTPATSGVPASYIGNLAGFDTVITNTPTDTLLTRAAYGLSNVKDKLTSNDKKSDQLTIQYQAPFDMTDCEGHPVTAGQYVVERIFARADTTSGTSAQLSIVLACEAGIYDLPNDFSTEVSAINQYQASATQLTRLLDGCAIATTSTDGCDLAGKGTVMVNRIDYFKVKLGVIDEKGIKYLDINEYCASPCNTLDLVSTDQSKAPIVAIQIGVIVRGTNSIGLETPNEFTVLGEQVTLDDQSNHYVRRVIEKTIRLKNSVLPANLPAAPAIASAPAATGGTP